MGIGDLRPGRRVHGLKKGFISIGRVVNGTPGMQVFADWLKTIVSEVPIRFISAGDPYWRPL